MDPSKSGNSDVVIPGADESEQGTPQYIAPEIMHGKESFSRDIFALAVVATRCITGHLPFGADDPPAMVALRRNHDNELSDSDIRRIEDSIDAPDDVKNTMVLVLARGLAKDPSRRQQSAKEFADDF